VQVHDAELAVARAYPSAIGTAAISDSATT
jgi:hypothetical protein